MFRFVLQGLSFWHMDMLTVAQLRCLQKVDRKSFTARGCFIGLQWAFSCMSDECSQSRCSRFTARRSSVVAPRTAARVRKVFEGVVMCGRHVVRVW